MFKCLTAIGAWSFSTIAWVTSLDGLPRLPIGCHEHAAIFGVLISCVGARAAGGGGVESGHYSHRGPVMYSSSGKKMHCLYY